ncbi:hypothetical protein IV203_020777 [Nitzschia inconspicua]|uniref:Uncharacterized protein n=1 Tax=Nitzschia inconspicua TaxID=303405 RepID=A0A9K3KFP5_9STRA|nr:hypothetical protein IV203_020777 [Nitzschia inconspicua]
MLAGPKGAAMVLPLTDDARTQGHQGNSLARVGTDHPDNWSQDLQQMDHTVDTIIDAIRAAAAIIDASMGMNTPIVVQNILLPKIPKYESIDRFDGSNFVWFLPSKICKTVILYHTATG